VKILLLIAMISPGLEPSVKAIEMTTLKQCAEVREALYSRGRILMCVESAVPLPEIRPKKKERLN
jgi:hypothetical protein